MVATPRGRVGVLVVRLWLEVPATSASLRARVTANRDLAGEEAQEAFAAASVDEVCDIVRSWMDTFLELHCDGGPR
jgi:hypothetical protein